MSESIGSLFVTQTGGITPALFLLVIGLPVFLSGKILLGALFIAAGLFSALKEAMREINESEKQQIRYNIFNPEDIIAELEILEEVWGVGFDPGTNVVDVYINYLRNKIDKPFETKLLHTQVGLGFVLKA